MVAIADVTSKGTDRAALASLSPRSIWYAGDIPSPVSFTGFFTPFAARLTRRLDL